ncbi:MAG: hypothetical protein C7B45_10610 [Sulfobacillus acidophilus]|uniref:Uncharacterized protein n=1 Tax=Sulfobacillus acidophilus TaxID=53633 RepID=A0A2T2WGV5_9FIRM|nr:MAG: hypothetical protein C7B45_10610 [Sulfobacillus acidophilus]
MGDNVGLIVVTSWNGIVWHMVGLCNAFSVSQIWTKVCCRASTFVNVAKKRYENERATGQRMTD